MKAHQLISKIESKFNSINYALKLESIKASRDHHMYNLFYKNQKIGIFQISRSSKEFGKGLIALMSRQLGISSQDLKGIQKCTFWAKDFIATSKLLDK